MKRLTLAIALALAAVASADEWYRLTAEYPNGNQEPVSLSVSAQRRELLEPKVRDLLAGVWGNAVRDTMRIPAASVSRLDYRPYESSARSTESGRFHDVYLYCAKRRELVQLIAILNLEGLGEAAANAAVSDAITFYAMSSIWFPAPNKPDIARGDITVLRHEPSTTTLVRGAIPVRNDPPPQSDGRRPPAPPAPQATYAVAPGHWFTFVGLATEPGTTLRLKTRYTIPAKYPEDVKNALARFYPGIRNVNDPAYFNIVEGTLRRASAPIILRENAGTLFYAFSTLPADPIDQVANEIIQPIEVSGRTPADREQAARSFAFRVFYPGNGITPANLPDTGSRVQPAPPIQPRPEHLNPRAKAPGNWYSIRYTRHEFSTGTVTKVYRVTAESPESVLPGLAARFPEDRLLSDPAEAGYWGQPMAREAPDLHAESRGYLYRGYMQSDTHIEEIYFESALAGIDREGARNEAMLDLARRWIQPDGGIIPPYMEAKILFVEEISGPPPQAESPPQRPGGSAGSTPPPRTGGSAGTPPPKPGNTISLASQKWSVVVEITHADNKKEQVTLLVQGPTEAKAKETAEAEARKILKGKLVKSVKAVSVVKK